MTPTVTKKDLKDGSCNFCSRGVLSASGTTLVYPYEIVYEIRGAGITVRICNQCIKTIKSQL